jgi:hypothetical protein
MSLPAIAKTWQYDVNNILEPSGNDSNDAKTTLLAIKNKLIGFGTLPWTVLGSSDSVTAALDATDRWTTISNIVFASAGSHSWIVLKQAGLLTNFQLLISCNTSESHAGRLLTYLSPNAGFTGGSTTTRPTATDEVQMSTGSGNGLGGAFAGYGQFRRLLHVMQSTDGQCTRIVVHGDNGKAVGWWILDKLKSPVTGLTYPAVGLVLSQVGAPAQVNAMQYEYVNESNYVACRTPGGAAKTMISEEGRGYKDISSLQQTDLLGQFFTFPGDTNGKWPIAPVAAFNLDGGGSRGRLGTFFDMWGGSTAVGEGYSYPADGSFQYAQFGNFIFPWNGTVPVIR